MDTKKLINEHLHIINAAKISVMHGGEVYFVVESAAAAENCAEITILKQIEVLQSLWSTTDQINTKINELKNKLLELGTLKGYTSSNI